MENMNFDVLNCIVSYLENEIKDYQIDDFNEKLNLFLSLYQLRRKDLDDFKIRFFNSDWKMIIFDNQGLVDSSDIIRLNYLNKKIITMYCCVKQSLAASCLYPIFEDIIYHSDCIPMAVLYNDVEIQYIKVSSKEEIYAIHEGLTSGKKATDFNCVDNPEMAYFIQLSDLHLGSLGKVNYKNKLIDHLDVTIGKLYSNYPFRFIITGDLMNSPSRRNMNLATDFLYQLKNRYKSKVHYILGNHDVVMSGFNMMGRQKSKIVSYVLQDNIEVIENLKVILIKLNSNLSGNFARGMVGIKQLNDCDREIKLIEGYENYTKIVLVHHHPVRIEKADFLKKSWKETKLVKSMLDKSKDLIDAQHLLRWMEKRDMHIILHGHQHIPAYNQYENIHIIGAGSSTGVIADKQDQYLSYNVICYDVKNRKVVSATLYYEDELNQLPKRTYTRLL